MGQLALKTDWGMALLTNVIWVDSQGGGFVAYWVKLVYERNTYLVDLESISAFSSESNKRITFWLPNSSQPLIIHYQTHPEAYKQILEYLKKTLERPSREGWIKIGYERNDYFIDLNRISSFACEPNGRITFWLPESTKDIIINPQSNPEAYQKLQDYIKHRTGLSLP